MRKLELRHNNAYDTVLLIDDLNIIGAWTVTPEVKSNWENPGDLNDWGSTNVDEADPEAYGELVSTYPPFVVMSLDKRQGKNEDDRDYGYVCGDDGGWFFTWLPTLEETLDSLEVDEVDGDGGLDKSDVREFLSGKIASEF